MQALPLEGEDKALLEQALQARVRADQAAENAENDAAGAELALLQARIKLLLDRLRLEALAGQLDETQLTAVNSTLAAQGAPR